MPASQSNADINADWIRSLRAKLAPELQEQEWYTILVAATASAHLSAQTVPLIYDVAIDEHAPRGQEQHDANAILIQRRIKEALVKGSVLYGIPASIDGVFQLLPKIREDYRRDPGRNDQGFFSRKNDMNIDQAVDERGKEHMRMLYQHNLDEIMERMGTDMEDLKALTIPVNYGWNLSDLRVLNNQSTELVILAALVAQNLRPETLWHMRGALRVGWSHEAVDSVRNVAMEVAEYAFRQRTSATDRVPRLDEVRNDSNEL